MMKRSLLMVFLMLFSTFAYGLDKTSTGFYYPIGEANFDTAKGWWLSRPPDYFSGLYHIGVDMMTRATEGVHSEVYAIGDGEVIGISENGWGTGNIGLFVQHRKSNESPFIALYAHLAQSTVGKQSAGSRVIAGEVIGRTGYWSVGVHLHFAIHDGPYSTMARKNLGRMPESNWPDTNTFTDPVAFIRDNSPYNGGEPVIMCAKKDATHRVCWQTRSGEDRLCEHATLWYMDDTTTRMCQLADSSICFSGCSDNAQTASSFLDLFVKPAFASTPLNSCAKRETGEDYVFGNSSPGAGSSTPATDSAKSGKPNFVGKSIRLYDASGAERYSFKKTDTIRMVGKLSNNGSANIPSDKDVDSMFLLSKGYNEDPHGEWQVVGRDETRSDNIEVGDTQQEEETLKLWERSDIVSGRVYNIVFCADRKERDNNNGGEFEEIHESDNCTTEAAFEVEGTYNFVLASFSVGTSQPVQGTELASMIGIRNTLDQPNEDVAVSIFMSASGDWNGRWLVDSFVIPPSSLPSGGTFLKGVSLTAPSAGDYMLWACVNPNAAIPESSNSDNCQSVPVTSLASGPERPPIVTPLVMEPNITYPPRDLTPAEIAIIADYILSDD